MQEPVMGRRNQVMALRKSSAICLHNKLVQIFEAMNNMDIGLIPAYISSVTRYVELVCDSLPHFLWVRLFRSVHYKIRECVSKLSLCSSLGSTIFEPVRKLICSHVNTLTIYIQDPKYWLNDFPHFVRLVKLHVEFNLKYSEEEQMIHGLKIMPALKRLTLICCCTNDIIRAAGENCRALEKVTVKYCNCVTSDGVKYLVNCRQLRYIDFCMTSVSVDGFANLLYQLPVLEKLRHCNIVAVLEHILQAYDHSGKHFNITEMNETHITFPQMTLIVLYFPNITNFVVYPSCIDAIPLLHNFKHLRRLHLYQIKFDQDCLETLKQIGNRLVTLTLSSVPLTECALPFVGECCPNLKELIVFGSIFLTVEDPIYFQLSKNDSFSELKCLRFEGFEQNIVSVLSTAHNVRNITLDIHPCITYNFIHSILKRNPLKYLQFLYLKTASVGVDTVHALASHCNALKILSISSDAVPISNEQLADLRENLRKINNELELIIS